MIIRFLENKIFRHDIFIDIYNKKFKSIYKFHEYTIKKNKKISVSTIYKYLNNDGVASKRCINKLEKLLGFQKNELIGEKNI